MSDPENPKEVIPAKELEVTVPAQAAAEGDDSSPPPVKAEKRRSSIHVKAEIEKEDIEEALDNPLGRALARFPVVTNIIVATLLAVVADLLCQFVIEDAEVLDVPRFYSFSSFGGLYVGGVCYFIYALYPGWYTALKAKFSALPDTDLALGAFSSGFDNFAHVPFLYTPAYYLWVGLVGGSSWDETIEVLVANFRDTVLIAWIFWIPIQLINFGCVPGKYQVIFMNIWNLAWNVVLDYISFRGVGDEEVTSVNTTDVYF